MVDIVQNQEVISSNEFHYNGVKTGNTVESDALS
jgi:hypothetical protein